MGGGTGVPDCAGAFPRDGPTKNLSQVPAEIKEPCCAWDAGVQTNPTSRSKQPGGLTRNSREMRGQRSVALRAVK